MTDGSLIECDACDGGASAAAGTPFAAGCGAGVHGVVPFAQNDRVERVARIVPNSTEDRAHSGLFDAFSTELLKKGNAIRFQARGASMSPAIRDAEIVYVKAAALADLRVGDIVLLKGEIGLRLHRLVVVDVARDVFITRGDCGQQDDPAVCGEQILGVAEAKDVRIGRSAVRASLKGARGRFLCGAARGQRIAKRLLDRVSTPLLQMWNRARKQARTNASVSLMALLFALVAVLSSTAQVAVDSSSSGSATIAGAGSPTLSFSHTTTATGTNTLLIVGVSVNITNAPTTALTAVSYNGAALTFAGAHHDAGNTRRVEMWYQLAPASGAHTVIVTVNIPTAVNVGVVAGATTFTGVDQTVPLGSFVSADGAAGGNTQLDVPSVVNGMILDTLATDGTQTVTVSAPQVQAWNVQQGNNTNPGVNGTASTRTGAPSVPISETFSGTSNWSLGALSINPTTADIGVSTSVSAVALGQNSVFNITIFNNGLSAANNVTLTDTWAATNLSLISVAPSAGTSCTTTTTINCTLPASFASGATATITVTVNASAAGFYPNTATVTDSLTPPDPNSANNTYIALAPVVSIVCTAVTLSPGGTLAGVLNTYYPGTASVAAGANAIPVGTATGAGGAIANGSLLLVIQMQDASINTANSVAYGNGSTGSGFTAINNSGNYEFVKATGAVSGGSVPITGAGIGGGLVFGYTAANASGTKGKSTYQVVLVPQYLNATLSSATPPTAAAWNGSSGGVLALDIAQALNLGGATVSVNGLGFRGGAGMQFSGGVGGAATDFRGAAPATYTGAVRTGVDAAKGEGVAGTPAWVQSGVSFLAGGSAYPSGTAGTDGSMARGAPGNAGGGGTDGDPTNNDQNAGGGGGGNGGSGGFGGDSWNSNLSSGGEGGAVFPATIDRLALGGGGGAGSRNDDPGNNQASSAAAGGGLIFIRANSLTGTGTLTANGASAYNGTLNDAGGGGGSGGTIVILTATGGESGLTLSVNGGNGGNAWQIQPYSLGNRHGPGGGGGGGVIFVSGAPASASVSGGASGLTLNTPGVPYGATAGNPGASVINATLTQVTGVQSAALCTPDVTLGKSHVGNFTRGLAASYTIPVSNVGIYGATSGVVTINDTLPTGITPTSAAGTGWLCSVSAQTVSCARSDALAAGSAYPSITINALVSQSSPAILTNTAMVGGGGEANLLNDIATDVANVGSSADMTVTDSGSPNPVAAGSNITYTQAVTNTGPSAADNATIVSPIPANTTFVSIAVPAGWSCTTPGIGNTGNVVCTNVNLAASTAGTFNLVVKVAAGTSNGTVITDTVSVNSSTADPNSANNTASVSTLVGTSGPDLTVTNAALPNPVQAGADITYTQVVTNTGSSAATTATFMEATPANTAFVSITPPVGWTCAAFPPQCTDASVAAGASATFTVVYKVNTGTASGTVITDTATVNAANQSFGANSATATDIVATATQADVALATVATPSSVISGNDITYMQAITNNGPAAATGLSFTEATPVNTTFASVSAPAGWTCTQPAVGASGSVNCTTPNLAVATSADIIVVVNVPTTVTAGTITANSTVTTTSSDPTAANNSTTVATPVTVACDLAVTNSGTPSPVTAGSDITYTQTVTNSGPSNCSAATFSEPTPANTTFVSVAAVTTGGGTWTCPNAAPVACTNPTVVPGSTVTITAVYKVPTGTAAGTIISDTASAATTSNDTNQTNNSATVQIAVASGTQADLSVTNSGSPNPVSAGSQITYTQSVSNAGPAAATTVSFTDPIPANTTVVSLTGPAGWACSSASVPPSCTIATLTASTTANFTFIVTVNTGVASGTTITQTDSVTSATGDPNAGNNSATATVQVSTSANLSVTDTASPIPVLAGATITYTQVVTNAGPSTATGTSVSESLPANTTSFSLSGPAGWVCTLGTLTCTNPSFAAGTPATITYVVTVNAVAAGTPINDTVSVNSTISDPNTSNNTATAADVVALATQADLITTNSALPTSVAPGSDVTYTQTVTNNGPAIATGVSFTQTTPPNTTFQSITPPAGWTCGTVPAVGGTGTITCTDGSSLAINGSGTFTVVLQVISATPSGTNITETATATATNVVPSLTSNSATASVVVAGAGTADVAIVKTATPSPTVPEEDTLTYTLTVTNNGPATATNVIVTDPLPTGFTNLSDQTTAGTCSEAGGTVTCLLGTMANAASATVTILTLTGAPGTATNTATVSADQTDPNPNNNTSTQTETITAATSIKLESFSAQSGKDKTGTNRVVLLWKTGREVQNLGFNIYREQGGESVQLNPSLIAGSALLMSGALPKHSGKTYAWIDSSASAGSGPYWLEDVDVNGTRILHGPVSASASSGSGSASESIPATSAMLHQLNQLQPPATPTGTSHPLENISQNTSPTPAQYQKQFDIAAHSAVKIYVKHEGWYRVTQPELVTAGLDPNVDPAFLHLYAEAIEQPIEITDASVGPGGFGPQAAVYFYGTGIDTQYSGTRVYFLAKEESRGRRIRSLPPSTGSNQPPASFPFTVELTPRTTYFSALTTANGNNFFGPIISSTPVDETIQVSHLDRTSTEPAQFDVILQGVILAEPHSVNITLNKTTLGDLTYTGQVKGSFHVSLPPGLLLEGANTITFTSQDGAYDYSLVQSIRVTYPHTYVADADELIFTGRPGDELKLSGFSQAPMTIVDITNPNQPAELTAQVTKDTTSKAIDYQVEVQVPWSTTNPSAPAQHTLIAMADSRITSAVGTRQNHPSHWHSTQSGSDIVIVSPEAFAGALGPVIRAHEAEAKSSTLVLIDDLYDEFNFGQHSPVAIRTFLQTAVKVWHTAPHYLLLNGRASFDPRNYLGFGHLDFVPTKIVATTGLMTASDDWFSDFNDSSIATIATGRLPVSTATEAKLVAGKVATYEGRSSNGPWTSQALMVADMNDTENFAKDSQVVQAQLPSSIQVTDVFLSTMSIPDAQQAILTAINAGQVMVNYSGHGSEDEWSGDNLFSSSEASALTNGTSLPVFLIMDCLNGFFQDVYEEPLAVSLMLAPGGGAVAVLASSGLNQAAPQTILDKLVVEAAMGPSQLALGDAILKAKSGITNPAVRKTYNLLGDPAMQIKLPVANPAH